MKESFVMRTENKVSIDRMSDADAGRLLKAILAHVAGEDVDDAAEPIAVQLMLPLITGQIDRADEKYQETVEKRRAAGALGGKAKQSQTNGSNAKQSKAMLSDANHNDPVPDSDIKKESPTEMRKSAVRFVPPTVDVVRAYVEEKGLHVDPERFVAFYASKNWMVGKNKMTSWHQAIVGWEARSKPPEQKSFGRDRIDYDAEIASMYAQGG